MTFKPYAVEFLKVIITNYQNNNTRINVLTRMANGLSA
ncbi:Uncharacterised protein [Cedecea neteri]|uniref:Uncharacterized protein n=1 Tax=Cedecea neteri TaxID=158822 RepID=A0A2X3J8B8_9ENTR|nr:Uncharacterised protein [Cedecea neteri]